MNYEFRTLVATDIPAMCKIITAIGIKEFRACFESEDVTRIAKSGGENADYSAVGIGIFIDLASVVLSNLPKCQNEIFAFLASISNLSKEDIEKMELSSFAQMIIDVIQKPELKDFIGVVSKLLK